ncbi:MAG TPA: ribonuclease J [Polyangiaceae bacterium]|nr:ribonuclease J [Polyangiaceae bacterium]
MAPLRIIPLGGLGEIGMNCLALEQRGEALLVDCGVTFDGRGLGVDVVHADFAALENLRIAGLFVTHGHEDHIGAIPYLLRRFDVPVYGPRYALGLVRERAAEHEILQHADLRPVAPRQVTRVGSFEVEPIRVTHSIADATALAIRTDAGLVVHTGDFKFDDAPPDREAFDEERFGEIAEEGVRLLMSDSTNVDAAGPTGSEDRVRTTLEAMIGAAERAVVATVFASNVHRLRMLGDIARKTGRKIVLLGRSVGTHARVARATARATGPEAGAPYLEWPAELVWPEARLRELPRNGVLVIATGSQGEAPAALARLARGEHASFELAAGDLVVMSSRVIPGNEDDVMRVMADLLRRGVTVRSWWSDRSVHVSGHAHREEQKRMIGLVKPQAFVPVHGTLHHLLRHADLAREAGVRDVCVLENGDVGELDDSGLRKAGRVRSGRVHVFGRRVVPDRVLDERTAVAARGFVHLTVVLDEQGRLARDIAFTSRGVLDGTNDRGLIEAALDEARAALAGWRDPKDEEVEESVNQAVRRALGRVLGFRPVTETTLVRLGRPGSAGAPRGRS